MVSEVDIGEIILKLISLIKESLRFAAEAWSSCSGKENVSATEARRVFLPVTFYLINAVKVVALFPSQASLVFKETALCVLMISAFKVLLSQQTHVKSAGEVMTDLLGKTTIDLLSALLNLNSGETRQEFRLTLLDSLFLDAHCFSNQISKKQHWWIFLSLSVESATSARVLLLARVVLFQSVTRYSSELGEDAKFAVTTKLQWLLDVLTDTEVYSSVLSSQLPVADGSGKTIIRKAIAVGERFGNAGSVEFELKKDEEQIALLKKDKGKAINDLKESEKLAEEANEILREALAAQKLAEESFQVEKFRAVELEQAGVEAVQRKEEAWRNDISMRWTSQLSSLPQKSSRGLDMNWL